MAVNQTADYDLDPIRRPEQVAAVKRVLADQPRDLLLFLLGINNGVRAGDLLRVSVNQVRDVPPGGSITLHEKHGNRPIPLVVPPRSHGVLQSYLETIQPPAPPADMYLFAAQPGWTPLTTQALEERVREWTARAGLEGRYGAHSLRKTFGYLQHRYCGVGFEVLAKRLGLPSPAAAMRYLGFTAVENTEVVLVEW